MNGTGGLHGVRAGLWLALALLAWVAGPTTACAGGPALAVSVGHPVASAHRTTTTWLKVAVTGQSPDGSRTPVNVAFVIDRSGSMTGDKIREARQAALTLLFMPLVERK